MELPFPFLLFTANVFEARELHLFYGWMKGREYWPGFFFMVLRFWVYWFFFYLFNCFLWFLIWFNNALWVIQFSAGKTSALVGYETIIYQKFNVRNSYTSLKNFTSWIKNNLMSLIIKTRKQEFHPKTCIFAVVVVVIFASTENLCAFLLPSTRVSVVFWFCKTKQDEYIK